MDSVSVIKRLQWRERSWWLVLMSASLCVTWGGVAGWLSGFWLFGAVGLVFCGAGFLAWFSLRVAKETELIAAQVNFFAGQEALLLYERSPIPYITLDQDGRVVECNQAAVHLLKTQRDSLLGEAFKNCLLPQETLDETVLLHKIINGLTLTDVEVLLKGFNDKPVWVLLSVYPHRDPHWRIVSLLDITERKAVDTAKSEFVALATHQLRTPIAAMRWNLELLTNKLAADSGSAEGKYLSRIERNVLLMLALIDDFLNVSKLEMGTFATTPERINLGEFFTSVFDEFGERITRKRIAVTRPDVSGLAVMTDSRLLHIIVSNLISNAVKYLHEDGQLVVSCTAKADGFTIQVIDNGIGIPESELGRLFSKFFRATNAHTQETEGTGLGLYVVKQSVEKLGGSISVESKENTGTTFTVSFPLKMEQTNSL